MTEKLKKAPKDIWPPDPLSWYPVKLVPSNSEGALVVCPAGHCTTLYDYKISEQGAVAPFFVCPHCSYKAPLTLEDWKTPNASK